MSSKQSVAFNGEKDDAKMQKKENTRDTRVEFKIKFKISEREQTCVLTSAKRIRTRAEIF